MDTSITSGASIVSTNGGQETEASLRCLLVDTSTPDARQIELALRQTQVDFVIQLIQRKEDLFRELRRFRPDVVLTDTHLPELQTMSPLAMVKKLAPHVPVVVITHHTDDATLLRCFREGAEAVVSKDHLTDIVPVIHRFWKQKRTLAEREQAEAERERLHRWFKGLLESDPAAALFTDREHRVVEVNRSFRELFDHTSGELSGVPVTALVDSLKSCWKDPGAVFRYVEQAMKDGAGEAEVFSLNRGQLVEIRCTPVPPEGETQAFIWRFRDVTGAYQQHQRQEEERQQLEENLRQHIHRWQALPEQIIELDLDGRLRYTNRPDLEERSPSAANLTVYDVLSPSHHSPLSQALEEALVTGETCGYEITDTEGGSRRLRGQVIPLKQEGKVEGYLLICRDVTEEWQHTAPQKFAVEWMSRTPSPVLFVDREGIVLHANEAGQRLLEHQTAGPDSKKRIWDLDTHLTPELWRTHWEGARQAGNLVIETACRTAEGYLALMEASLTFLPGEEHPPVCAVVLRDIGERKQQEKQLRITAEKFRELYEQAPGLYFTLNPQGILLSVNRPGAHRLGFSAAELAERPLAELLAEGDRPEFAELLVRVTTEPGRTHIGEFTLTDREGNPLRISASCRATPGPEGQMLVLLWGQDVSRQYRHTQQMQERLDQLEALAAAGRAGTLLIDAGGQIVFCNPRVTELLGMDPRALQGESLETIAWPFRDENGQLLEPDRLPFYPVWQGQHSFQEQELQIERPDGQTAYLLCVALPLSDEGEGAHTLVQFFDITEPKRQAQAVAHREEHLRELLETAPDPIFQLNPEGKILWVNSALEQLTGFSREEFAGMYLAELVIAEDQDKIQKILDFHPRDAVYCQEVITITGKGGKRVMLELHARPASQKGVSHTIQCVAREVTDRVQTEQALRRTAERFRQIFEASPDIRLLCTPEGIIREINASGIRALGYANREELPAEGTAEALCATPQEAEKLRRCLKSHTPVINREIVLRCHSGEKMFTLVSVTRSGEGEEAPDTLEVSFRDITAYRRAQQEALRNHRFRSLRSLAESLHRVVSQFTASILGQTELLRDQVGPNSPVGQAVSHIRDTANEVREILRRLALLSGGVPLAAEPVDFSWLVGEVVQEWKANLPESIRLDVNLPALADPVMGDAWQLKQALEALLQELREGLPQTGGLIRIALEEVRHSNEAPSPDVALLPGCYARLSIRNSLSGETSEMASAEQPSSEASPRNRYQPGTGFAIALAVAEAHGGACLLSDFPEDNEIVLLLPVVEGKLPEDAGVSGEGG